MFQETFAAELNRHTGSRIELATDSNLLEGILSTVTSDFVLVLEVNDGYGDNTKVYTSIDSINFVRLLQSA